MGNSSSNSQFNVETPPCGCSNKEKFQAKRMIVGQCPSSFFGHGHAFVQIIFECRDHPGQGEIRLTYEMPDKRGDKKSERVGFYTSYTTVEDAALNNRPYADIRARFDQMSDEAYSVIVYHCITWARLFSKVIKEDKHPHEASKEIIEEEVYEMFRDWAIDQIMGEDFEVGQRSRHHY